MEGDNFKKSIATLVTLKQFPFEEKYIRDMFALMKNDFTDEEFQYACSEIVKHEELYNKAPDPRLFYKYRDKIRPTEEDMILVEREKFIQKVSYYLSQNFISSSEKEKFLVGLTEFEKTCLKSEGGISELWRQVHGDFPVSQSKIIARLGKLFEDCYKINTGMKVEYASPVKIDFKKIPA